MKGTVLRLAVLAVAAGAATVGAAAFSGPGSAGPAAGETAAAFPPRNRWRGGTTLCRVRGRTTVGISLPLPIPDYALIADVTQRALRRSNVRFLRAVTTTPDPNRQITDMETLVNRGVRILIVAATNPVALQPVLNRYRGRGIKIVVTDIFLGGPYVTNVATSPFDAGSQGARYLRRLVGNGDVAAIEGPAFAGPVLTARNSGFNTGARRAGLNVVDRATNNQLFEQGARQIADAWRIRYGDDLRGIWAFNDPTGRGAASARSGSFQPRVISINGEPATMAAIRAGTITATWDLQPQYIGTALALGVEAARCNRKLPKTLWIPVRRYDRQNIRRWVPWERLRTRSFSVRLRKAGQRTFVRPG